MATDAFALTGSPYFNDLIRAAQACVESGHPPDGAAAEQLRIKLQFMREFMVSFHGQFDRGMEVRERTRLAVEAGNAVRGAMERLQAALGDVDRYLEGADREALELGLRAGGEAVEGMFAEFARLREEEATFPVLSSSPFVNELLRTSNGVRRGQFPSAALKEKLNWMTGRVETQLRDQAEWARLPGGAGPEHVESRRHLEAMQSGLREMARWFENRDAAHLERGGAQVHDAAEHLVKTWDALQQAAVSPTFPCLRCGHANPQGVRRCGQCSAVLPEMAPPAASMPGASLNAVEGAAGQRPVPTHLVTLESVVQAVMSGDASDDELRQTVDWFGESVRRGRQEFEGAQLPQRFASEADQARAEQVRDLMDAATGLAVQAADALDAYFEDNDRDRLRHGIELAREAADRLVAAHELTQAAHR